METVLGWCLGLLVDLGAVLGNLGGAWVLGIWFLGLSDHLGGTWSAVFCRVLGFRQASGYLVPFYVCCMVVVSNFFL